MDSVLGRMLIMLIANAIVLVVTIVILTKFGDVAGLCCIPFGAFVMFASARWLVDG